MMQLTEMTLIEFLQDQRQIDGVGPDTVLFSDGTIDSVGMIDLITFIETVDNIEIAQADVTLENFDTVSQILSYVRSKAGE
jgi:D-alanine--poly(phosphoribitol) ligase subunit 2